MVMISSTRDRDLGRRMVGGAVSFDDIALADEVEARATSGATGRTGASADRWAGAAGSFGDSPYAGAYPGTYPAVSSSATTSTPAATAAATPSRSELIAIYWQAHQGTPSTIIQGMRDFGVSVAEFAAATGQSVDALGRYLQAGGAEDGFGGWFAPVAVATTTVASTAVAATATPSRSAIIAEYWQAYRGTPSTIVQGMRSYGVSVAEFAAATGQSVDALGRYLQAGGAENGFGGWFAPVVAATTATTVTSTRSAEHNALILVFWEANKASVKTISDAMAEFKVSATELAFATGQTLEQVERYLREGAAAAAAGATTVTTAATDQGGAARSTTQTGGSTAKEQTTAHAQDSTTSSSAQGLMEAAKTEAATAPTSQLTPDQLTRVANYWTEHQADPYRIMQSMVENQVSAIDLAVATRQSVQDVADYLSRNGAPAGFAGSDCVDRDQVDARFLTALNAAAKAKPVGKDAQLGIGWRKEHYGHGGIGYSFDSGVFTAWYARQDNAVSRAFLQLHGKNFSLSGATLVPGHENQTSRSHGWISAKLVWSETSLQAGERIHAYLKYAQADAIEAAATDLTLSEPDTQELLANFGGSASLPDTEQGERMRARFGSQRASDLYHYGQASSAVLNTFIQAFRANTVHADLPAFTTWYVEQDSPASRAFKQLYGSTVTTELNSSTQVSESGEQTNTWTERYIGNGAFFTVDGQSDFHVSGRSGLARLDLANPPEMFDPSMVLFDPMLGFVTPLENLVPEVDLVDQLLPLIAGAVVAWFAGPAIAGWVNAAGNAVVMAGASAAVSSTVNSLITTGSIDLEDVLTGAVMAMATAGFSETFDLNTMGMGVDELGNRVVTNWADKIAAIGAKAAFSGILSKISGGSFEAGAGQVVVGILAGAVVDALNAQIADNAGLSPIERSTMRLFAKAAGAAIRILANPGDPQQAMAMEFVNELLSSIDTKPATGADTDTTPVTHVAFDDDGNLMPGIVDPTLPPEQQALQLSALLVSQGFSLDEATALAAGAIDRAIEIARVAAVKQSPIYKQFLAIADSLPPNEREAYLRELDANGVSAAQKLLTDPNLYFANPDIALANAKDATLNFAPSDKAANDQVFAGGTNTSLAFYYQGLDGVPNPGALPLAAAFVSANGDAGGNGFAKFQQELGNIGINASNAAQSAVYLVQPGMSEADVLVDLKNRLGKGFSQQLEMNPDVQAYLTERVSGAKAGQLVNISDFWQSAVGDTVQRAYNHAGGGYFRDVVDNGGTVPLFSNVLGGFNFKSIVATDDLAPQAYSDYARRSLGVDATVFLATTFMPTKGLGAALNGEVSLLEGRIGFAGLSETVTNINLLATPSKGGTFESLFYETTGLTKYVGPKLTGTLTSGQTRNTVPDLVQSGEAAILPGITDLKNVGVQALDAQLQAQLSIAKATHVPFNVVVAPNTQVYASVVEAAKATGGNVYVWNPLTKSFRPYGS